jgi:SAM-dependent methyltransferase
MRSDAERERLRETFDRASDLYDRARPDYPDELIDRLVALSALQRGDLLLEIGCGTGKATLPLAKRGFRIICLELGTQLAAVARAKLSDHPDVRVRQGRFEDLEPPDGQHFDLVFAATAWHWVDPAVGYRKAWDLLRPAGHLAFWGATHVFPEGGDPFFFEIQDVYDEIGERLPPGTSWPKPGELDEQGSEIEASELFDVVDVSHFDWEIVYDADGYIDLLNTFSGHIAMQPQQRDRLYSEIRRRLAARRDGRLRRHWGAVLHIARRRE